MKHALEVYYGDDLIFNHDGKWLYPLFELEEFLKAHDYNPAELGVHDKIIGRAAALVEIHLGIRHIKAGMMSKLAEEILQKYDVEYSYEKLVDRIACATEDLLIEVDDPQKAYEFIKKRAKRN